jgi:3-(3-hydroxy-phenyl)propionate hydroxylase
MDPLTEFFLPTRPPELDGGGHRHHPVIVVGAGPVGLSMALEWSHRGHPVLVLTASTMLSEGSRAICFAKRTLEIFGRLGCCDPVMAKGVSWNLGKVFLQDRLLYEFDLLPEAGHARPAFVNIQQYYVEQFLLRALDARRAAGAAIDLRWDNRVTGITRHDDRVDVMVECRHGSYALSCDWLVACDGASSLVRKSLGLKSEGQVFQDRFLIADVRMRGPSLARFRNERWFWFDPPFHRRQSALLHRQADDVWRIDFQLGWQANPEVERRPERVVPRIREMLGRDIEFELEWVSVYTFQCRRMERFVHGRVIFAGDAAHQVSPFGARGANSGIQDVDNLGWKLDLVARGMAPVSLLDTYDAERVEAADENILNSTRSTDFITPKSDTSRMFRDATLELAARYPFARKLVNSGRLSVPAHHRGSPLNTPDAEAWPSAAFGPGSPALDAPIFAGGEPGWLLERLCRRGFTALLFAPAGDIPAETLDALRVLDDLPIPVSTVVVTRDDPEAVNRDPAHETTGDAFDVVRDREGLAFARYAPEGEAIYLLRPDQHVAGRRRGLSAGWLGEALRRATRTDIPFTVSMCS